MRLTAKSLKGIFTALSVPFNAEGEVDNIRFNNLLEVQMLEDVDGFVVNGTTGESPCLSPEEQDKLFIEVFEGSGTKPVIAGVGGNNTQKTLKTMRKFVYMGTSAFLTVVPYYNRPPQRGLIKHFNTLASTNMAPLILYNVPSRTGQSLSLSSIVELSRHPNIIGIKEASGDLDFGKQIIERTDPEEFSVLSGDDETGLKLCALGGNGIISVVSHIITREMKVLLKQIKKGGEKEKDKALKTYKETYGSLLKALYAETNPIGIKMALKLMGLFETANMRLPLIKMGKKKAQKLEEALQKNNLLFKASNLLYPVDKSEFLPLKNKNGQNKAEGK